MAACASRSSSVVSRIKAQHPGSLPTVWASPVLLPQSVCASAFLDILQFTREKVGANPVPFRTKPHIFLVLCA